MADNKQEIKQVAEVLAGLFGMPQPSLGIDIDGCIDEAPRLFSDFEPSMARWCLYHLFLKGTGSC
jgi:hypothetical protein